PFDADAWADLSDGAMGKRVRLEHELATQAGEEGINWTSLVQVLKVLQGRGHAIANTDEATLRGLAEREPLARLLLDYREATKLAKRFGIEFAKKYVPPTTGRIHPDYLQLGADTGRMSCRRPNLQQVPRDPAYRACFRAPAGRMLVKADYSQIELRIAAELTDD